MNDSIRGLASGSARSMRRLVVCAGLLPLLAGILAGATATQAAETPNIVFIYADDLGYGDVGCYNSESKVPTPNLDRLATEGMRFTDAHSPATVCTPSRYGVMTGRMPFRLNYRGVFTGVEGPCLITAARDAAAEGVHHCHVRQVAHRHDVSRSIG
jgi:hypothetical protein